MINQIISGASAELGNNMTAMGLPVTKTGEAIALARDVIAESIRRQAADGNLRLLMKFLQKTPSLGRSVFVQSLAGEYSGIIIGRLKIRNQVAEEIASFTIAYILEKIGRAGCSTAVASSKEGAAPTNAWVNVPGRNLLKKLGF